MGRVRERGQQQIVLVRIFLGEGIYTKLAACPESPLIGPPRTGTRAR